MKNLFIALMALLTMIACSNKQQQTAPENETPKTLVLYYSQTGATKAVAEALSQALNADIEAIEAVNPYDGSYDETIQRCIKERTDSTLPELKPIKADLSQYDRIFLGYPIWFGTYALPMASYLSTADLSGKEIVPFCTFGSGGLEVSVADLKAAQPDATVKEGYGVRNARVHAIPQEVNYFLVSNGYVEGEVETLPEYSELLPVTEEEVTIFDAACGDYPFPLGTPVVVGKRTTSTSTDYIYKVNSKDMQGNDVEGTVYVTVANGDDAKPEFTKVVR